jgi:hypothetical protein
MVGKQDFYYSETCLNCSPLDQLLCSVWTGIHFIQVKLTTISYIATFFKFSLHSIPIYSRFDLDRFYCSYNHKLYHIMLYTSPRVGVEPTTSVVIGTYCIGSCKSNYHMITVTTTLIRISLVQTNPLSSIPKEWIISFFFMSRFWHSFNLWLENKTFIIVKPV